MYIALKKQNNLSIQVLNKIKKLKDRSFAKIINNYHTVNTYINCIGDTS